MIDNTVGDQTQQAILPLLSRTEQLLSIAATRVNGRACDAEIVALPDLGLATNSERMRAGFFTGALYRWEGTAPWVPVDATVNVCGVALYRLGAPPPTATDFRERLTEASRRCLPETGYEWNLATGNHFAAICSATTSEAISEGSYLILHASASEHKRTPHGLYPSRHSWFAEQIQEISSGGKRLRFIAGNTAERFIAAAHSLVAYNERRLDDLADLIAGDLSLTKVSCMPHYGMPDSSSVAIGCHWLPAEAPANYVLLTEPEAPILIVAPGVGAPTISLAGSEHILAPHGLGVRSDDDPACLPDFIAESAVSTLDRPCTSWRSIAADSSLLSQILTSTPGRVVGKIVPDHSYHRGNADRFNA